ncbi:3'-5' exonuclease [Allopusillimonas soli]|uniref:3'-5' exonuclease n=1 Tax=Allopusillimonas soli TaxID=659016 RepID=A0A853FDM0_9BURK|nr:3'-5' exonuclease [Allopusillimonas soli]NYT36611.1 3'-5' exonuclease [Allopusillimonas soli]TEA75099.1 3'-5' exonuclease [Allopusillimonas soli]
MIPVLVFDLETIPDADGLRRLNPHWRNLPDTEVIEKALEERRATHGSDFLPLHLHKVAVVGCVFRDDNGFRVKTLGQPDDPEPALLSGFFKTIERYTPRLVSWNGSGFDLPVLHYRSLIHGVQAPRYWDMGDDDRDFKFNNYISRYHNRHIDLMDLLAKYNGRANAPLDDLAKLCGFPGKLGMDGGQVWRAWSEGRADEVRAYCETDVVNTWLVYCRFRFLRGELDQAAYDEEITLVRDTLQGSGAAHWQEYMAAWNSAD